jgi:hypothetical protein
MSSTRPLHGIRVVEIFDSARPLPAMLAPRLGEDNAEIVDRAI